MLDIKQQQNPPEIHTFLEMLGKLFNFLVNVLEQEDLDSNFYKKKLKFYVIWPLSFYYENPICTLIDENNDMFML